MIAIAGYLALLLLAGCSPILISLSLTTLVHAAQDHRPFWTQKAAFVEGDVPWSPATPTLLSAEKAMQEANLLDINTATAEQLKALPGIGDAYLEKVIKGRPYKRKDELVQKKTIPRLAYEQNRYKVVVKQN